MFICVIISKRGESSEFKCKNKEMDIRNGWEKSGIKTVIISKLILPLFIMKM